MSERQSQSTTRRRRIAPAVAVAALVALAAGVVIPSAVGQSSGRADSSGERATSTTPRGDRGEDTAGGSGDRDARAEAADDEQRIEAGGSGVGEGDSWFTVERRDFLLEVMASGELEAIDQVDVKSQVEGQNAIVYVVAEGQWVEEGELLVRLADDQIREKVQQEELQVEQARATLKEAEQKLSIRRSEADSEVRKAEMKLELSKLSLAQWREGTDRQKERELDLALEKARRNLDRAKRDLELSRQLEAEKFISTAELEDDEIALIEAENALQTAELNRTIYDKYERPRELTQHASDVDEAEAELDRTRRSTRSDLEVLESDLASKRRQYEIRLDGFEKRKQQLDATEIRAPRAGMVVYASSTGSRWRRPDPIEVGREVRFNETIMMLPNTEQMIARLRVHEAMMAQVRKGQRVKVTVDALPGRVLEGEVDRIAVLADSSNWMNPDLREYTVKATLSDVADLGLKPGMRAHGRLIVGDVRDALAAPVQAVFADGEGRYVFVPAPGGGKVQRRDVRIGRSSDTLVEITAGLEPGEQVLLRRPEPRELASSE